MARTVNIHAAKTHLSKLLEDVETQREEIVIARAGRPVARLVPLETAPPRRFGSWKGRIDIADDFDAPLPPDVLAAFEVGPIFPRARPKRRG
jgi:prevent-host-death family protein